MDKPNKKEKTEEEKKEELLEDYRRFLISGLFYQLFLYNIKKL